MKVERIWRRRTEREAVWLETAGEHPGQGRGWSWELRLTGEVGPEHGGPLGVGVLLTGALGES